MWITDDVEEDYTLIDDLKKLITSTSKRMYEVTRCSLE